MARETVNTRKPKPGKSLAELNPEVAAMADGWDPTTVTASTHKKMPWICSLGHKWESSVSTRNALGAGCPICSNQRLLVGFNDLATTHPELAAQANGWNPQNVIRGSNKKFSWKCRLGHVWVAGANDRVQGKGCPYCSGNYVWVGFNDLATTQPELSTQAHGWDPKTITSRSGRKRDWLCDNGHVYSARVADRTFGSGCPVCQNDLVVSGINDLTTTHPDIALQADGWDPTTVVAGSARVLQWRCGSGHAWNARVNHRTNGLGCPVCSNKLILPGINDLATTHPELALWANPDDAQTVTAGSGIKIRWRCPDGHDFLAAPSNRQRGGGCPVCSKRQVLCGVNDLATLSPNLAAQADGWDPTTVSKFSNKRLQWKCELGHVWKAVVAERQNGHGCQYCSGRDLLLGFNDLRTTHPDLAAQADGWNSATVTARSGVRKKWKCKEGHSWTVKVNVRAAGRGCPYCSGTFVWAGFNDLATTRPLLADEAHGWDPTKVSRGSKQKLEWKCKLDHLYIAAVGERDRGSGCPFCAGQRVMPGFNDFATVHPRIAIEADGWDPTTVPQWSVQMMRWRCPEGHCYKARIGNRSNGRGCPACSKGGFDQTKNGYLYFLEHEDWEMFQIGITNVPKQRLNTHGIYGWKALDLRGPMDGFITRSLESAMLRALKDRGAIFANKLGGARFDGWTEAWMKDSLHVTGIKEILGFVYQDEAK